MAGGDAGFAAGTLVELDLKGVLLAGLGLRERDEVVIMPGLSGQLMLLMGAREFRHGGQGPLFGEQLIDERDGFVRFVRHVSKRERSLAAMSPSQLSGEFIIRICLMKDVHEISPAPGSIDWRRKSKASGAAIQAGGERAPGPWLRFC